MKRLLSAILLAIFLASAAPARKTRQKKARNPSHSHGARKGNRKQKSTSAKPRRHSMSRAQRHFYARHPRNKAAEEAFERQTGYPHDRPGYVVDHIRPLACGGADDPSNMLWQTIADAKAKDKWERKGCN